MKKKLRDNIYITLLLTFIVLAFVIYYIISVLYPAWVLNTLMKIEPGYLLFQNDKLGKGTFGDMYGALNTFFSGLAFLGLLISIFLQINIHRREQQYEKEKITNEEKYLLYYMWFRFDKIVSDMAKILEASDGLLNKFKKRVAKSSIIPVSEEYANNDFKKKMISQIMALDLEKNHLIYLKYLNDDGLIKLFEQIPNYIDMLASVVPIINKVFDEDIAPEKVYYNKMVDLIMKFESILYTVVEITNVSESELKSIKSHLSIYTDSVRNKTIEFLQLQTLSKYIIKFIDDIDMGTHPYCIELYKMKEYLSYKEQDFIDKEAVKLESMLIILHIYRVQTQHILERMKKYCKIPKKV